MDEGGPGVEADAGERYAKLRFFERLRSLRDIVSVRGDKNPLIAEMTRANRVDDLEYGNTGWADRPIDKKTISRWTLTNPPPDEVNVRAVVRALYSLAMTENEGEGLEGEERDRHAAQIEALDRFNYLEQSLEEVEHDVVEVWQEYQAEKTHNRSGPRVRRSFRDTAKAVAAGLHLPARSASPDGESNAAEGEPGSPEFPSDDATDEDPVDEEAADATGGWRMAVALGVLLAVCAGIVGLAVWEPYRGSTSAARASAYGLQATQGAPNIYVEAAFQSFPNRGEPVAIPISVFGLTPVGDATIQFDYEPLDDPLRTTARNQARFEQTTATSPQGGLATSVLWIPDRNLQESAAWTLRVTDRTTGLWSEQTITVTVDEDTPHRSRWKIDVVDLPDVLIRGEPELKLRFWSPVLWASAGERVAFLGCGPGAYTLAQIEIDNGPVDSSVTVRVHDGLPDSLDRYGDRQAFIQTDARGHGSEFMEWQRDCGDEMPQITARIDKDASKRLPALIVEAEYSEQYLELETQENPTPPAVGVARTWTSPPPVKPTVSTSGLAPTAESSPTSSS